MKHKITKGQKVVKRQQQLHEIIERHFPKVVSYPGAVSTGPQHLTLDDEPKTIGNKAMEWAKENGLNLTKPEAILVYGMIGSVNEDRDVFKIDQDVLKLEETKS